MINSHPWGMSNYLVVTLSKVITYLLGLTAFIVVMCKSQLR